MRISDWSSDVCSSDLYALDGSLKATPFIGGPGTSTCEGFDKAGHGLKPVRSAVWADAVFVDLSGQAPAFADFIAPIAQRWADFDFTRLRHGGADSSFSIEVGCNWRSEEHTSELQSLMRISYAVFCLKKKKKQHQKTIDYAISHVLNI